MLLGLALACPTWKPKPLLLFRGASYPLLLPEIFPTSLHNSLISLSHLLHSLKRWSLLCLPPSHHQHASVSVHPYLSLMKGAIMAWPLSSWKYRDATPFLVYLSRVRILGLAPLSGPTNASLPSPFSLILVVVSGIHRSHTLSVTFLRKNAKRRSPRVPRRGGRVAASFAVQSALSFPSTPTCAGVFLWYYIL